MFTNSKHSFSFGSAAVILLFDVILMFILAILIDGFKQNESVKGKEKIKRSVCEELAEAVENKRRFYAFLNYKNC